VEDREKERKIDIERGRERAREVAWEREESRCVC
jgi:hypothetical protein